MKISSSFASLGYLITSFLIFLKYSIFTPISNNLTHAVICTWSASLSIGSTSFIIQLSKSPSINASNSALFSLIYSAMQYLMNKTK
jgi:hypothetical protein